MHMYQMVSYHFGYAFWGSRSAHLSLQITRKLTKGFYRAGFPPVDGFIWLAQVGSKLGSKLIVIQATEASM